MSQAEIEFDASRQWQRRSVCMLGRDAYPPKHSCEACDFGRDECNFASAASEGIVAAYEDEGRAHRRLVPTLLCSASRRRRISLQQPEQQRRLDDEHRQRHRDGCGVNRHQSDGQRGDDDDPRQRLQAQRAELAARLLQGRQQAYHQREQASQRHQRQHRSHPR